MTFARPSNAKQSAYRVWVDELLELLAEADSGRAAGVPRLKAMAGAMDLMRVRSADADASCKANNWGWDKIMAAAAAVDPTRVRSATKADRS